MTSRTLRITAAVLAVTVGAGFHGSAQSAGAPDTILVAQAADINAAIAAYLQAEADLNAARQSGGDTDAAQARLDEAQSELESYCQALGLSDVQACIAAVNEGGPAPAQQEEPAPAEAAPAEQAEPAPAEQAEPAPAEQAEPAPAEQAEPAPVEQVEPASVEQVEPSPAPDNVAQPAEATEAEPAPDAVAEPSEPAEPASEPAEQDNQPSAELLAAVTRYEDANAALADAVATGADTAAPLAEAQAALADIEGMCSELGDPDTTTCLDRFGIALTPLVEVQVEQPAPAGPAEPAEQPAPSAVEGPATPLASDEQAAPEEEPAPAEVQPPADESASGDTEMSEEETPLVTSDESTSVNPSGTPMPRDLASAVGVYEQANRQLGDTVAGTAEADAAQAAVTESVSTIEAICAELGEADTTTCLGAYGVALTPAASPQAEAGASGTEEDVTTPAPEDQAPILDSAKETLLAEPDGEPVEAEPQPEQEVALPQSDAEAQAEAMPETVESIEAEQADSTSTSATIARESPAQATIVEQSGPRIVFNFNNQLFISNQSDSRMNYGASETYFEQLPRGRVRETIVRSNGTRLVTIYNRNGDILRRSRFDAQGNEIVLAYVPERYDDNLLEWYDPGRDLPPLYLSIPREDYVLDADEADLEAVAGFLDAPPVERVQRLYSIDEVKRSARLRDMVRRLEIGNLTFGSGDASIPPDQIGALSIVANAMYELIDQNPAETFLIEGHTDAVGSDYSNLILSDERAYSVGITLTEVFGVPPENIATQGYGERYLKVNTPEAERANRRVTIRRITPLVAPTSANIAAN